MLRARLGSIVALAVATTLPATATAAVHADRDGDKIFDDLEPALAQEAPRSVLVSLSAPAGAARVDQIERAIGDLGTIVRLRLVDAFSAQATPRQIRALAQRADVVHVEENATVVPFGIAAQASFGVTRAREDLPELDGHGLVAAVIDSGIDTSLPDLPRSKVIAFEDLVQDRPEPYDDADHGSQVSTIMAGSGASGPQGRGVAPAASLVGVKVVDSSAQSNLGLIAQGIQWVVENRERYGIDVINLSIGEPKGCGDGTDVASQAVDAAVAAGIVVVAAAGNAGPAPCTIKSPAAAESALTVGAMADTGAGGFTQAWFSSRGPTADERIKPDVSAPGVAVPIPGADGTLVEGSGTSAAAPFVSGTALLMLQANPGLTPAQVKAAIQRTAVDWGVPGRDNDYGYGRLDAYAALQAVGAALAVPPRVPRHAAWNGSLAEGQNFATDVLVGDAAVPLAVTMNGPGPGFDVTVVDQAGASVGKMTTQPVASRQEDITLKAPAPGRYTISVHARVGAGDFALDVSGDLLPGDTTAPGLTVAAPAALTNDATPDLEGAAGASLGDFPGVVVRVRRDGEVVRRIGVVPLLGRWTARLAAPLPDGAYVVDAEQGDDAGNVARVSQAVAIDTTAPQAPVVDVPADGDWSPSASVTLAGSAEPGATVAAVAPGRPRATATAGPGGGWSMRLDGVEDGEHAYAFTATDAAGNVSPASHRVVRVDTVGPAVVIDPGAPVVIPAVTAPIATPPRAAPALRLAVPRQRLAAVLRSGLSVRVGCTWTCSATLVLKRGTRIAARRSVSVEGTRVRATLRLSPRTRKALARVRRVTLTLTVSAPGAREVVRRVTLTR